MQFTQLMDAIYSKILLLFLRDRKSKPPQQQPQLSIISPLSPCDTYRKLHGLAIGYHYIPGYSSAIFCSSIDKLIFTGRQQARTRTAYNDMLTTIRASSTQLHFSTQQYCCLPDSVIERCFDPLPIEGSGH